MPTAIALVFSILAALSACHAGFGLSAFLLSCMGAMWLCVCDIYWSHSGIVDKFSMQDYVCNVAHLMPISTVKI